MIRSILVIGPSGNGKSTLARALADRLGWSFLEGDLHHPPGNLAKLARGEPLNDADRAPFLQAIAAGLARTDPCVGSCSALKRSYRELIEQLARKPILYVVPVVSEAELRRRVEGRSGHFMHPSLLASQIATFEPPGPEERAVEVDGLLAPEVLARQIEARLRSDEF